MRIHCSTRGYRSGSKGFTITEVLVASAIMAVVAGASLGIYLYGFRMFQMIEPKLTASKEARNALANLTTDVRSAAKIKLGTRTGGAFVELPNFSKQVASAMMIHHGTNTNVYALYYWDGLDETVKRTTNTSRGAIIAKAVTNEMVFTAEDYRGNPYTNQNVSIVIGVTLKFDQMPITKKAYGTAGYHDYYQVRTKINKRAYF